jgi:FAD/FMN-containing dehydrogenases
MVSSAKHVQDAVMFAKRHNLRLIVRNTGHDLAGRSSSPNALQIHTNRLQGVHFHENFQLHRSERSVGPAVSVEAGVMMGDLYAKSAQNGYIVVGGDCPTVGVAGGFLQGGGVSDFLSLHHGLAVDNALEFEVVTASVSVPKSGVIKQRLISNLGRVTSFWPTLFTIRTYFGHCEGAGVELLE